MEKNLKRVHRWIDRCMAACGNGKWDSALAEVECAKAELESARESIWEKVSGSQDQFRLGQIFALSFRSMTVALILILVAALPISTVGFSPMVVESRSQFHLEWVTTDEQSVLSSLRKSLSEMNFAEDRQTGETFARPYSTQVPVSRTPVPDPSPEGTDSSPALDEILALIEIGQRALRGEGINIQSSKE